MLRSVPAEAVAHRVGEPGDRHHQELESQGERLWSPNGPSLRGPMVALVDEDPERQAGFLAQRNFHTSPRGPVLRLSFHGYNHQHVDAACRAIRDFRAS